MIGGLGAAAWTGLAHAEPRNAASADALLARFSAETGIADASVAVMAGSATLYRRYVGRYDADTQVPIASSSKWMFGALVMTLVDDGQLRLDAPIGDYLPELPPAFRPLRLDALMSYTAGLAGLREMLELRQPAHLSLLDSALAVAETPLTDPPGTRFEYGGASFQLVGAAAERVSGQSWHQLFKARIADPLEMTATAWGRLRGPPDPARPMGNPVLQAGVWTTLSDYSAFLTMIAQGGTSGGRRVLSPRAMAAMGTIMTAGLPKGGLEGAGMGPAEYMIAHWCERPEGDRCSLESSPGYFGADPWIDRRSGLHGVLLVQDQRRRIARAEARLRHGLIEIFS